MAQVVRKTTKGSAEVAPVSTSISYAETEILPTITATAMTVTSRVAIAFNENRENKTIKVEQDANMIFGIYKILSPKT